MQQACRKRNGWRLAGLLAAGVVLWRFRGLIALAVKQLMLGIAVALMALPLMKKLERRLPGSAAAAMAIAMLNAALAAVVFLLVPVLIRQGRELTALVPSLWQGAEEVAAKLQMWLERHGGSGMEMEMQSALLARGKEALGEAVPALVNRLRGMAGDVGQWLLAPVFGFYYLRDRRMFGRKLMMLLPVGWREPGVRMLKEMRRETACYLRGQLLISGAVGALTAAGLLLCGVPAWLALGAVMGVLELIPYVGPLIGGVAVALFTLPQGLWRTLWALGVVLAVQQAESSALAPGLISQTTRLHPTVILLCILLGGAAAGVAGILLSVPLVLCGRAALRVLLLYLPREK